MGKEGGFLEYGRKDAGYRPKEERIKDFRPVELRLTDADVKEQSARCMDCGVPFCHGCGCPLGNVIPEFNDLVYRHKWKEALEMLLETSCFPEFTGRICPAPCEASCVLGVNDDPVNIRQIELAIIEKGFELGYMRAQAPIRRTGCKVAVIGSGPGGLAVAQVLNRRGHEVTVFEKDRSIGGILRYGIPDFKLEKSVIDRRVVLMREEGVRFETGVVAGEDISFTFLRDRFDSICLAGGARDPRDLCVPGRQLEGIYFAMQYLKQQNARVSGEPAKGAEITAAGKTVVVIGGGDTGSDCIGTAIRQGAKKVYQFEIMPKPPVVRAKETPWPMWPNMLKETSSHKEGCERKWSVNTVEFAGADGVLKGMKCQEVKWTADAQGRMKMDPVAGSEFDVKADLVFLAMGFLGPRKYTSWEHIGVKYDDRCRIVKDGNCMTSVPGIFVTGDMSTGQSLVVRAMADGMQCACYIDKYLETVRGLK